MAIDEQIEEFTTQKGEHALVSGILLSIVIGLFTIFYLILFA